MLEYLSFKKEVKEAILLGKPVVALESTVISHGLPYPRNIEVARQLEQVARDNGVIPATICLKNGKIQVGLDDDDLEQLATAESVEKVSRRDIAGVLANKKIGATTVAATMICAHFAGIKIFATGGIGGVHRFAEKSFDISADLLEFSKTPVIVVSAGAKAILDLPKTLEYFETHSVPVFGYKTDKFPAFYSSKSSLDVKPIHSVKEISKIFKINQKIDKNRGMVIANPIPKKYQIPFDEMEIFIDKAIKESVEKNITGKDVTPFLLGKLVEITKGNSLEANIKLLENNVKLASQISKELS